MWLWSECFVFPKTNVKILNPKDDDISKWDLWEVLI